MSATECLESGKVVVRYISTHTNHESDLTECKHLPLPPSVKKEIQLQFAGGVSMEKIIDSKQQEVRCTCICMLYTLMCSYRYQEYPGRER